jgi:hypothetical protein
MSIDHNNICLKARSAEATNTNVFNELREVYSTNNAGYIKKFIIKTEDEYMYWLCEQNGIEISDPKYWDGKFISKKGNYLYGKHLPGAYKSAKSVVQKSVALGIELGAKGKSQLQKEIREEKRARTKTLPTWRSDLRFIVGQALVKGEDKDKIKSYLLTLAENLE